MVVVKKNNCTQNQNQEDTHIVNTEVWTLYKTEKEREKQPQNHDNNIRLSKLKEEEAAVIFENRKQQIFQNLFQHLKRGQSPEIQRRKTLQLNQPYYTRCQQNNEKVQQGFMRSLKISQSEKNIDVSNSSPFKDFFMSQNSQNSQMQLSKYKEFLRNQLSQTQQNENQQQPYSLTDKNQKIPNELKLSLDLKTLKKSIKEKKQLDKENSDRYKQESKHDNPKIQSSSKITDEKSQQNKFFRTISLSSIHDNYPLRVFPIDMKSIKNKQSNHTSPYRSYLKSQKQPIIANSNNQIELNTQNNKDFSNKKLKQSSSSSAFRVPQDEKPQQTQSYTQIHMNQMKQNQPKSLASSQTETQLPHEQNQDIHMGDQNQQNLINDKNKHQINRSNSPKQQISKSEHTQWRKSSINFDSPFSKISTSDHSIRDVNQLYSGSTYNQSSYTSIHRAEKDYIAKQKKSKSHSKDLYQSIPQNNNVKITIQRQFSSQPTTPEKVSKKIQFSNQVSANVIHTREKTPLKSILVNKKIKSAQLQQQNYKTGDSPLQNSNDFEIHSLKDIKDIDLNDENPSEQKNQQTKVQSENEEQSKMKYTVVTQLIDFRPKNNKNKSNIEQFQQVLVQKINERETLLFDIKNIL